MKTWSSILNWFLPFCVGIFTAHFFIDFTTIGVLLIEIVALTIGLIYLVLAQKNKQLPLKTPLYLVVFFILGFSGYQANQSILHANYFSQNQYNYLEAEITEIQKRESSQYVRLIVEVKKGINDWGARNCSGKGLVYVEFNHFENFKIGQKIIFPNNFEVITNKNNPGEFDATSYWNNLQIYHISFLNRYNIASLNNKTSSLSIFKHMQHYFSDKLEKVMSGEELAIAKALLLGEKSEISSDLMNAFSGTGAMHLLSVSGLHIGIFVWIMQTLIALVYPSIKRIFEVLLLLVILWIYTGITGFSPSVNRAAIMFSFLLLARLSGKQYSSIRILFISAFVLLLYNPNYLFDIGFQLSYAAMIGIFTFYRPIASIFTIKNYVLLKCWETTAVGIAAQITTLPLTLYYFHQFPNYFILTNIGLMVFSGVILGVGVAFLLLSWVPFLSKIIGIALFYSIHFLVDFIQYIYQLPFSVSTGIPFNSWDITFLVGFIFLFSFAWKKKRSLLLGVVGLFSLFFVAKNYQYLNKNYFTTQLWVLNNSSPAVFMKNDGKGYLLLQTNTTDFEKKSNYLLRGLKSQFGKNIEAIQLKRKESITFYSPSIAIKPTKNGLLLLGSDTTFYLTGKFITPTQLKIKKLIIGTWVPYTLTEVIKKQREKIQLPTYVIHNTGAIELSAL